MNSENLFTLIKWMLMINVTLGPCILMAFLWRRINLAGAWVSMGIPVLLTIVIPVAVTLVPGARYNSSLLQEVQPPTITKSYEAKTQDVQTREAQLTEWDLLNAAGKAIGMRPAELQEGDTFEQVFIPPAKAIFWESGIKMDDDGRLYGSGLFRPELYLLHTMGMNLDQNSVSFNECMSLLFKLIFPFAAILILGYVSKPTDKQILDRFYGRLLTPVNPDAALDAQEVALTYENPHRFDHTKLFPQSAWNIRRWGWSDWKGVVIAAVAFFSIGLLMYVLTNLGR